VSHPRLTFSPITTCGWIVAPSPTTAPGRSTANSEIVTLDPIESVSMLAFEWIDGIGCGEGLGGRQARRIVAEEPQSDARLPRLLGVEDCKLVELPVVHDPQGNLTFVEQKRHVPFEIARVYHLYDVPGGAMRGGHAHRGCEEMLIAMSGSFEVVIDDGARKESVRLSRSYLGLYLPPMIWRELIDFSSGSVCMVLASEYFDEGDYIRDYTEFEVAVSAT